ncbi:MAG TPA: class I poly(R)-hydroxyalkanoic acid synthase [Candidatus Competibacteraceae bacterium]|nr:MAG: class I poly(R)-hydroxyalkanoic acid synthase [Candidatus Competibacteraceae bacterium]HOB62398.1 class I poly(R)-hydroxyalkanoic acid synthase [Candidatus Competibacteraceae bacterium]HQA26795.1 class I poly(R)-hydroxyalkanoic acid synthase [Candidatus Competibacteraceae bacterium]HQD56855.1 class I poly(R)-hydroxyalkanoic acid synthase [Candidatus Competibacteraceae bacterium]
MATSTTTSTPDAKSTDFNKLAQNLSKIVEQSQRVLQEYLKRQEHGDPLPFVDPVLIGKSFQDLFQHLLKDPDQLIQAQTEFWKRSLDLWQAASKRMLGQESPPVIQASPGDKRFKDAPWTENVVFDFIKQSYLLAADSLQGLVNQVEGLDDKTARKVQFYTRQFVDAMAPTNFVLTNPTVLQATLDSGGDNLVKGLQNMLADLERGRGQLQIKMTDLKAFTPGENIAVTPGKVVFQNDLLQLIQYAPSTPTVHQRPFLFVSPWINKFYIMDMRPKNSMVKWMVDQGFTVFMTSWVNPDERLANKQFEDYMLSIVAALDAIEQATGEREVNTAGYCLGGTLLLSTLAYLAAQGDQRVQSAICFACMTDFSAPGELEVFIDEELITLLEKQMGERGYLDGSQMAGVFSMLRANDLIWYFVVNNYLLGNDPYPFDLLYWNSDSTRMPRDMHSFYVRNMYQKNLLREPGGITLAGVPIDLGQIKTPVCFLSAYEDHIAPWTSTYAGTQLVGGPVKFVLSGSGHIAGVINPASSDKYGFWLNPNTPPNPDDWFKDAVKQEGSWWPDWLEWLKPHAGPPIPARTPGDGKLKPIEAAPGSYVKMRYDQ